MGTDHTQGSVLRTRLEELDAAIVAHEEHLTPNLLSLEQFKADKKAQELASIASRHALEAAALQSFVDEIVRRRIFDGERLSDLMAPLGLGWKARTQKELALMADLAPLLRQLAQGHEISGLSAYEQ